MSYQYIEVDPYKKPQSLLDVNPRGLVPAIRHGPTWSTYESTVIMEYLEDLQMGPALLPPHPQARATCRLWTDHINRKIVPIFYHLLQAQEQDAQVSHAEELKTEIGKLVVAADAEGPFFLGREFGFVDIQIAPWVVRLKKVLGPYRGWPEPEEGSRWKKWVDAIEGEGAVRRTTSDGMSQPYSFSFCFSITIPLLPLSSTFLFSLSWNVFKRDTNVAQMVCIWIVMKDMRRTDRERAKWPTP